MTLALKDHQLRYIVACCQPLAPERRSLFLRRLTAHLRVRGLLHRPSDADIKAACREALAGLVHEAVA